MQKHLFHAITQKMWEERARKRGGKLPCRSMLYVAWHMAGTCKPGLRGYPYSCPLSFSPGLLFSCSLRILPFCCFPPEVEPFSNLCPHDNAFFVHNMIIVPQIFFLIALLAHCLGLQGVACTAGRVPAPTLSQGPLRMTPSRGTTHPSSSFTSTMARECLGAVWYMYVPAVFFWEIPRTGSQKIKIRGQQVGTTIFHFLKTDNRLCFVFSLEVPQSRPPRHCYKWMHTQTKIIILETSIFLNKWTYFQSA